MDHFGIFPTFFNFGGIFSQSLSQQKEVGLRDVEQREAVLRATNKQLQDSLQRHMNESASREERLRDEINEMRKKWQDALTSKENLASELVWLLSRFYMIF